MWPLYISELLLHRRWLTIERSVKYNWKLDFTMLPTPTMSGIRRWCGVVQVHMSILTNGIQKCRLRDYKMNKCINTWQKKICVTSKISISSRDTFNISEVNVLNYYLACSSNTFCQQKTNVLPEASNLNALIMHNE